MNDELEEDALIEWNYDWFFFRMLKIFKLIVARLSVRKIYSFKSGDNYGKTGPLETILNYVLFIKRIIIIQ